MSDRKRLTLPSEALAAGRRKNGAQQSLTIIHQVAISRIGAVPFQHGEFRVMGRGPFAVAERMGKLKDFGHARRQQLFHGEFGRGVQVDRSGRLAGHAQLGSESVKMRLHAGTELQHGGLDFDKAAAREKRPNSGYDAGSRRENFTPPLELLRAATMFPSYRQPIRAPHNAF